MVVPIAEEAAKAPARLNVWEDRMNGQEKKKDKKKKDKKEEGEREF